MTVAVDTELSPELIQEGYARDLVRTINNMRKDAGLDIADRINLVYQAKGDVAAAFATYDSYIRQETLALTLEAASLPTPLAQLTVDIGSQEVLLAFAKV